MIDKLPLEIDALSLLSEALNFDFATKGMDEAFTDEEMADMSGLQGIRDRVVRASGKRIRRCANSSSSAAAAGCTTRSSAGPRRSPTGSNNGSSSAPATASSCRQRTCPAPTRISCASSCRNCSAAACSARSLPARPCATISGYRCRRSTHGAARTHRRGEATNRFSASADNIRKTAHRNQGLTEEVTGTSKTRFSNEYRIRSSLRKFEINARMPAIASLLNLRPCNHERLVAQADRGKAFSSRRQAAS